MILDALLSFVTPSSPASVAHAAGSVDLGDAVDFGLGSSTDAAIPSGANGGGARDMGVGDNPALKLLVQVGTGLDSVGGAATLQITLLGAPDDGTGAPGAYVAWWSSPAYTEAQAVAGARLLDMDFPRPPQGAPVPRFVKLQYTIDGETSTAGTINYAGIVIDRDDQMYNGTNNAVQGGYRPGLVVSN